MLYGQLGESERARQAFDSLEAPEGGEQLRLARALRKAGLYEEARACLAVPASPDAHAELALLSASEGDCEEALAHFEAAPPTGPLHLEHGRCLETMGRASKAIDRYRAALHVQPGLRAARFRLGNLLLRTGEREEAMTLLEGYETYRQWEATYEAALDDGDVGHADA